ncbi:hypothetical protein PMAYCL1PPCAC_25767, partial [Pristionchus mayeri]
RANSGKFVINDGTGDKEIGSEKYMCGEKLSACQTCDQSKLLDPTHAACSGQMNIICDTKPISTPDTTAEKCPMLSCSGADAMLYLLTDDVMETAIPNPTAVKCVNGMWQVSES